MQNGLKNNLPDGAVTADEVRWLNEMFIHFYDLDIEIAEELRQLRSCRTVNCTAKQVKRMFENMRQLISMFLVFLVKTTLGASARQIPYS